MQTQPGASFSLVAQESPENLALPPASDRGHFESLEGHGLTGSSEWEECTGIDAASTAPSWASKIVRALEKSLLWKFAACSE